MKRAALLYLALSVLFFGVRVLDHPGSELIGAQEIEPSQFSWFLAWWPWALGHGHNPFHTELLFAPGGYNLAWATGIPGPSLLLAPVTLTAGPVVAYNVLAVLCPALSALAAFALCRHVTGALGPSLVGGYLYGFSAYVLTNLQGIPNFALAPLIPLAVLLVVRHVDGTLSTRAFVPLLGALLVAQFLVSNEVLATLIVFGAIAMALAAALLPAHRAALWRTAGWTALAFAGAAVVLGPYLYWMFFEPSLRPTHAVPERYSADLLSFAFPTGVQRLGRHPFAALAATFGGEGGGPGGGGRAYLGLPLLLIVGAFAVREWRRPGARLLVAMLGVTALAALGPKLHVAGVATTWLPWEPVTHLPLLRYAIPANFAVYPALLAALAAAWWLARRGGAGAWLLAAAAVACLFPNLGSGRWHTGAPEPAFFAGGGYARRLSSGDRLYTVPVLGAIQRWQAQEDMPFAIVGGYVGRVPPDVARLFARVDALAAAPGPGAPARLRALLARRGVTAILLDERRAGPYRRLLAGLGVAPVREGGVLLYRLRPAR